MVKYLKGKYMKKYTVKFFMDWVKNTKGIELKNYPKIRKYVRSVVKEPLTLRECAIVRMGIEQTYDNNYKDTRYLRIKS